MMQLALRTLSPAGRFARLSTLIFHRVVAEPDPLFPDEMHAARFDEICRWARRWFCVLPVQEAVHRLQQGSLPARAMAITFDDGYADNHDVAFPILQRHGLHATFFVATGFLNGGRMWNDTLVESVRRTSLNLLSLADADIPGITQLATSTLEQRRSAIGQLIKQCRYLAPEQRAMAVQAVATAAACGLPSNLMMSDAQVLALYKGGMGIGGHTVNHPILARTSPEMARLEIAQGRDQLQQLLQQRVTLFAYPNGRPDEDYSAEHVRIVQELGFDAALTTAWGSAYAASDCFQLPRFTPWDQSRWRFGLRMLRNLRTPDRRAALSIQGASST